MKLVKQTQRFSQTYRRLVRLIEVQLTHEARRKSSEEGGRLQRRLAAPPFCFAFLKKNKKKIVRRKFYQIRLDAARLEQLLQIRLDATRSSCIGQSRWCIYDEYRDEEHSHLDQLRGNLIRLDQMLIDYRAVSIPMTRLQRRPAPQPRLATRKSDQITLDAPPRVATRKSDSIRSPAVRLEQCLHLKKLI